MSMQEKIQTIPKYAEDIFKKLIEKGLISEEEIEAARKIDVMKLLEFDYGVAFIIDFGDDIMKYVYFVDDGVRITCDVIILKGLDVVLHRTLRCDDVLLL